MYVPWPPKFFVINSISLYNRLTKRSSFKNMSISILVNCKRVKAQGWVSQSQSRSFTCMVGILE